MREEVSTAKGEGENRTGAFRPLHRPYGLSGHQRLPEESRAGWECGNGWALVPPLCSVIGQAHPKKGLDLV